MSASSRLVVLVTVLTPALLQAQTITFDDIDTQQDGNFHVVPVGYPGHDYAGFTWTTLWAMTGSINPYSVVVPASGPNVIWGRGVGASFEPTPSFSSPTPFNVRSIDLGFFDPYVGCHTCPRSTSVTLTGLRGGTPLYQTTVTLSPGWPQGAPPLPGSGPLSTARLDWTGVDRLTLDPGFGFFVADNVVLGPRSTVPEPRSIALTAVGAVALGLLHRRRSPR